MIVVVMGVAGSGKSTIGAKLAGSEGWTFLDGDSLHSPANTKKMSESIPLTEEDRAPWLLAVRARIESALQANQPLVVACSALKESHRQVLRVDPPSFRLVYLKGDPETLRQRLRDRQGHFMKESMLESQLAILEEPTDALVVDISEDEDRIVERIRAWLRLSRS
jgi:gluconokinase